MDFLLIFFNTFIVYTNVVGSVRFYLLRVLLSVFVLSLVLSFKFVGGEFSDVCRNMSFDFDLLINHKIKYYIVE